MLNLNRGITFRPLFLTTNSSQPSQASLRLIPAFLLILILLSPAMAHAQGNYVYVNNQDVANSISGFAVSFNGQSFAGGLFCFGREDVQTFTQFPVQKPPRLRKSQD